MIQIHFTWWGSVVKVSIHISVDYLFLTRKTYGLVVSAAAVHFEKLLLSTCAPG